MYGFAALLMIPYLSPYPTSAFDLARALLIEGFCVAVFLWTSLKIVDYLRSTASYISRKQLLFLIGLKGMFFAANYYASGGQYGVFSNDSRIDYLALSPFISKTRYFDGLIDFVILLGVGICWIKLKDRFWFGVIAVCAVNLFGLLTGSKGGTLLLTAYAVLLLYAAFPSAFSIRVKTSLVLLLLMFVSAYISVLSSLLVVELDDLLSLSLVRFVLAADARLMAFDPDVTGYVLSHPHGSLLAELFRGAARAIGVPVAEFSMGVYQFEAELGTTNYVGSTSQLTALFVTYGRGSWVPEFLLVALLVLSVSRLLVGLLKSRHPGLAWLGAASAYQLNASLAQGFEAYVQLLPICIVLLLVIWGAQQLWQILAPFPRLEAAG
jgi:hypothetical protein